MLGSALLRRSTVGSQRRARCLAAIAATAGLVMAGSLTVWPAQAAGAAHPYDFNGDGYADLAMGVPGESLGSIQRAGAVQVLYGGPHGLTAKASQFWSQNSKGVKGKAGRSDAFGRTLTSADFDRDGYADLAVGIPGSAFGSVAVLYGSRGGLSARDQLWYPTDLGHRDVWGGSLTTGDFDGDGRADLAIGGDPASPSVQDAAGAITVLRGSRTGLTLRGAVRLTKNSPGVAGTSKIGDAFGMRLAAGDVNADGRDDLVAAARQQNGVGRGVYYLPGSPSGTTGVGSQYVDAATPGLALPGTAFETLGSDVALADFDDDGHTDLAVSDVDGTPPGDADCTERAQCPGTVLVLRGTDTGLSLSKGKQLWYGGAPGLPDPPEVKASGFGAALATGDLNGDDRPDLAIGAPGPGVTGRHTGGAVTVLYGSTEGLTAQQSQLWTQDSRGIKGVARLNDRFGQDLLIADFGDGDSDDLAAGALNVAGSDEAYSGSVNVLYGSQIGVTATDDYWTQDSPGLAGSTEEFDEFGVLGS